MSTITDKIAEIRKPGPVEDGADWFTCRMCGDEFGIDRTLYEPTPHCDKCAHVAADKYLNALETAVKALEEISWNKLSRERLPQGTQDQRVARSTLEQIEQQLK